MVIGCTDTDGDGTRDGRDCAPEDPAIHPDAEETCDGVDNNCNGQIDEDVAFVAYWDRDGDGYGDPAFARRVCTLPEDGTEQAGDCDDDDPLTHEGAPEICDEVDNDCDGVPDDGVLRTFYVDADGDGRGSAAETTEACFVPIGYAPHDDDCDDGDPAAWTDRPEVCDGRDNDCDGAVDEDVTIGRYWADADGDGFGDPANPVLGCGVGPGVADNALDCDDTDANHNPDTVEIRDNGVDDDCDGYEGEYGVGPGDEFATFDDLGPLAGLPADAVIQFSAGTHVVNLDLRDDGQPGWTIAGAGCERTTLLAGGPGAVVRLGAGTLAGLTLAGGTGDTVTGAGGDPGELLMGGGVLVEGATEPAGDCEPGDAQCVRLRDVCVINNSSTQRGGGVAIATGRAEIVDTRIAGNGAGARGGGVYVHSEATLYLRRSELVDNVAGETGGGLHVRDGEAILSNVVIAGNRCDGPQGCGASFEDLNARILNDDAIGELSFVTFHANQGSSALAYGVALAVDQSRVHVTDSLFTGHADDVAVTVYQTDPCEDRDFNRCAQDVDFDSCPSRRSCPDGVCGLSFERVAFVDNAGIDTYTRISGYPERDREGWVEGRISGDPRFVGGGPVGPWDLRLRPSTTLAGLGAFAGDDAPIDPVALDSDEDGDGVGYGEELAAGSNPWIPDADADLDGDGLDLAAEVAALTDPAAADTDRDGVSDGDELSAGTDPRDRRDQAPVADAGPDRWAVWVGEPVPLSAAASFDPQGATLGAVWALDAVPGGSAAAIAQPTMPATTFTPDVPGTYRVRLTVDDGTGSDTHTILVVAWDGVLVPDQAATVAEAAAGSPGQTIGLRPGTWDVDLELAGSGVTLVGLGDDADAVVLQGDGQGPLIDVEDGDVVRLANLTVTGGAGFDGGALAVRTADLVQLDGVVVRDNRARRGGGLFVQHASVRLRDAEIVDNAAETDGGGLFFDGGEALTAEGGTFAGNRADRGGAVYVGTGTRCFDGPAALDGRFERTRFAFNEARVGAAVAHVGPTAQLVMDHVDVVGHTGPVWDADGASFVTSSSAFVGNDADLLTGRTAGFATFAGSLAYGNLGELPADVTLLDAAPGWALVTDDGDPRDDVLAGILGSALRDAGVGADRDGSAADIGSCGGPTAPPRCLRFGRDGDGDGLDDGWELRFGLDPTTDDAGTDRDGDGLTAREERIAGTDPTDADSDADGVTDDAELLLATDPLDDADHRPVARFTATSDTSGVVTLDGSASDDPDGAPIAWAWTLRAPAGSAAALADPLAPSTAFTVDVPGRYDVRLVVDDGAASRVARVIVQQRRVRPLGDFTSLADAVAAVGPDDVIELPPGETVVEPVTVGAAVALQGADGTAVLVPAVQGRSLFAVTPGGELTLSDLSIRSGSALAGAAVACEQGVVEATRVVFADHVGEVGGAVSGRACAVRFTDVDLLGNEAAQRAGGMDLVAGTLDWTRGRMIGNVAGWNGGAIQVLGVTADVRNVVISGNESGVRAGAAAYANGRALYAQEGLEYEPGASSWRWLTVFDNGHDRGGSTLYFQAPTLAPDVLRPANDVTDSVFAGNQGTDPSLPGRDVAAGNSARVNVDRVAFDRPISVPVRPTRLIGPTYLDDVLDLGFGDPGAGDLRLSSLSQVRDQGPGLDRDGTASDYGAFGGPDAPDDWDLYLRDTDGDGLDDGWEILVGLDPLVADSAGDPDGDGLDTIEEYGPWTLADGRHVRSHPLVADTDGDGVDDGAERLAGTDPTTPDGTTTVTFSPPEVTATVGVPALVEATASGLYTSATWRILHQPPTSALTDVDLVHVDLPSSRFEMSFVPQVPGRVIAGVVLEDAAGRTPEFPITIWVDGDLTVPGDYDDLAAAIADVGATGVVRVAERAEPWPVNVARDRDTTVIGDGAGVVLTGERRGPVLTVDGGFLTLQSLTITGGRGVLGGGVAVADGSAVLTDVTFADNEAYEGGGLHLLESPLTARGLRLLENLATSRGGGMAAVSIRPTLPQVIDVRQSLLAGNVAGGRGGAALIDGWDAVFTNVVFADNIADEGGAIRVTGGDDRATLTLEHVTATYNAASTTGSFLDVSQTEQIGIRNTILFRQQLSPDVHVSEGNPVVDLAMRWTLLTGNLEPPFDFEPPATELPVPVDGVDGNQIGRGAPGFVAIDPGLSWRDHDWTLDPTLSTAIDAGEDDAGELVDLGAFGGADGAWSP